MFHNAEQTCQSFPEAKGLSLSSYLIMPVQRIPRYTLLLEVRVESAGADLAEAFTSHLVRISSSTLKNRTLIIET